MTKENQLQTKKQDALVTNVATRINEMKEVGQIDLPDNYSVSNALQSAYFTLTEIDFGKNQSIMDKCTPESVAFALKDMAIQGLSVAKKQGYFVPYGNKCQFIRSYHGTQAVLKRLDGVKDVWANVIWKGEEFEVDYNEKGRLEFKSHKANWKAATGKAQDIEGAYCIIEKEDGEKVLTIMTMEEIEVAWSTSKNKSVQQKYPQEMAKRTVINRASKSFINTSNDNDLLADSFNRASENEHENERKDMGVIHEVEEKANMIEVKIPDTFVQPNVDLNTGEIKQQPVILEAKENQNNEQSDLFQTTDLSQEEF